MGLLGLLNRIGAKKSKAKFKAGELVIYNDSGEVGNEKDVLYLVQSRMYGTCTDKPIPQWYYFGNQLKLEKTSSKGLPYAPFFLTGCWNTSEEYLHKLIEIKLNKPNLSAQKSIEPTMDHDPNDTDSKGIYEKIICPGHSAP